jgi:hypothetical protein
MGDASGTSLPRLGRDRISPFGMAPWDTHPGCRVRPARPSGLVENGPLRMPRSNMEHRYRRCQREVCHSGLYALPDNPDRE